MSEDIKPLNDPDREKRIEKIKEQYKKDMKNRPSQRPMGYIFPKRIQQIMHGETPIVTVGGFHETTPNAYRKVGEEWTDSQGKTWRKVSEGYIERVSELDDIRREIHGVKKCSKCSSVIKSKLDRKFYNLKGQCFDCVIKEETRLIGTGEFEAYAKRIQINNAMSFFKDAKDQIEEYLRDVKSEQTYVNEDGSLEKWYADVDKLKAFFKDELDQVNLELKNLQKMLDELGPENKE